MPSSNPSPSVVNEPQLDENVWLAWLEKNRVEEQVRSRRMNIFFVVILIALAVGAFPVLRDR